MKTFRFPVIVIITFLAFSCPGKKDEIAISSPNQVMRVIFTLKEGIPYYRLEKNGFPVLLDSRMGFRLSNNQALDAGFVLLGNEIQTIDTTWDQPWGEVKTIHNNYRQLTVTLQQAGTARLMKIVFRLYNDGLGFRYVFPKQEHLRDFEIMDEETQFALKNNDSAWWIPAFKPNRYEYLYRHTAIKDIDTAATPFTIKTLDGGYLSIHEAALVDFPSMTLYPADSNILAADLVPWKNGIKAYATAPFSTPWRTVEIADKPGDLVTNYLILNLNEPSKIKDVSWIKPVKYIGIWWGMHIGKYTWGSGPKHGATTQRMEKYIDFASKYGFKGVLAEGWNTGWDGDWMANGAVFSFTTPYPDYDLEKIVKYADSKNVGIVMHNETSANTENYENQIDSAYSLYEKLGIHYLKTGYVGTKLFNGEWHHGQFGVEHYQKTVELAAKHKIMLDIHEPIKATGLRRTWPNLMSREGARGMEYNAWSPDGGNPPNHVPTLVFTRFLSGPMDYTPGIFDLMIPSKPNNRVNTTLAKQLAYYVIIYSPLQMAADLPENYEGKPGFQFIVDVPCDWSDTRVLNGEIGQYVTIVRKDRNSENWYLGSITDENPREFTVSLDFLDPGKEYKAQIYADGKDADWKTNPYPLDISERTVKNTDTLDIKLAPGGGQAIRFVQL